MSEISVFVQIMDTPNHVTEPIFCLYVDACDAEAAAIKANREEITCWCFYARKFKSMYKYLMVNNRVGEKKAKGQVYDFIIKELQIPSAKLYVSDTESFKD